jgi:hypothetical protein
MMKRSLSLWTAISAFALSTAIPTNSLADCSCKIGSNYISVIGVELTAKSCPGSDAAYTDTSPGRVYNIDPIECRSSIYKTSSWGDVDISPAALIAYYHAQGYKIITNPSGSHMIAIQQEKYPYTGKVAGISISSISQGTAYVTESLNQLCARDNTLPDSDDDGFPDCLDCAKDDPELATDCPTCTTEYSQLITTCTNESLIAEFDYTTCSGFCKDNGPPMCQN